MICKKCKENISPDCILTGEPKAEGICVFCYYDTALWETNGIVITKKESILDCKYFHRPRQWFLDRIHKKIWRKKLSCTCKDCQKNWVTILDRQHANYIFLCSNEEGICYYDEPIGK